MSFWGELRRRNVVKVAIAYSAMSWLLIQLVTTIEEPLGLPPWFDTFIIVCLAVGFPVALVFAWAFELTRDGIKPTESVAAEASITPQTGRKLTQITIGVLTMAVALLIVDRFLIQGDAAPQSSVARAGVLPNSIAVLPLENLSPNPDDAFFAIGLHEEILNQLAKLRNVSVIARTTMSQYAGTDKAMNEIAGELNVETVMEGSVRYANGRVRVTTQLIDGQTGIHLWSDTYDEPFEDIFAIESDIAMNVANAMAVEFSLAEQQRLEEVPTSSADAYRLLMSSKVQTARGTPDAVLLAISQIDEATRLDPESPAVWTRKAITYAMATRFLASDRTAELESEAEAAANQALQIDATYGDAYIPLSMIANNRGDWIAMERFSRNVTALGGTPNDLVDAVFDFETGKSEAGLALIEKIFERDPLNATASSWLIHGNDALGDTQASLEAYASGSRLFVDWFLGDLQAFITYLGAGDSDNALGLLRDGLSIPYGERFESWLEAPERALEEIDRLYGAETVDSFFVAAFSAFFGDHDLAARAFRDVTESDQTQLLYVWRPLFRQVRQRDEFRDAMHELGVVDYWREYGWPDLCRPLSGDDFVCD